MLILSRKKGEAIQINDDITVSVVEIRGDKVRVGVTAPKDVSVHRLEVYNQIHREASIEIIRGKPHIKITESDPVPHDPPEQ